MGLRLHHWIRDIYLATADRGDAGLEAILLARVAQLVPHANSQWLVIDLHGKVISHCVHDVSGQSRAGTAREVDPLASAWVVSFVVSGEIDRHSHRFTFRREPSARSFDADERALMESIVEHLVGAHSLSRRIVELSAASSVERNGVGAAVVDKRGQVTTADVEFTRLLRGALPDWDGQTLPFKLPAEIDPTRPGIVYQGLWVAIQLQPGGGAELRVRPDRRAIKLSDRELEIAERVAEGYTFREIGAEIGVAPSTVSTHLYNLYAKLGIRRRAELVGWLRQHRRGG